MQKLKQIFSRKSNINKNANLAAGEESQAGRVSQLDEDPFEMLRSAEVSAARQSQSDKMAVPAGDSQTRASHASHLYQDKNVIIGDHFVRKSYSARGHPKDTLVANGQDQDRNDSPEIIVEYTSQSKDQASVRQATFQTEKSSASEQPQALITTTDRRNQSVRKMIQRESVLSIKTNTQLTQNVMRQINMDIFKNIVQSKRRVVLTAYDREQLWLILRDYNRSHKFKDLQKPANHRRLWLKCSGALGQKLSNPGYYEGIKRQGFFYPNPAFIQIELDLPRTYPHVLDEAEMKQLIEPLRHVLYAIVIRNPTIGYCQGMNFIAARLLNCMREEEAFWTMTQIVERYLPFDYYSNMIGVLVDQKVLQHFMHQRLPKLCEHLQNMQFSLDLIAFQWIACLFSINLPQQIHFAVWDLFFIKGVVVIIRFALTILALMEKEILTMDKFEDIYFFVDQFCQEKLDTKTLMEQFADRISMREIEELRIIKRREIMEILKKQLEQTQRNNINQFPRLKFISNFQLYHGLSKYYNQIRKQTGAVKADSAGDLIQKTLDKCEQDLMSIFDCDPSWPLCLYDFTHKNACPKFVKMKVQQPLDTFLIDDYFFSSNARIEENQLRTVYIGNEEVSPVPEVPFEDLVIERDYHVCQDLRHANFVPFFKKRFSAQDKALFQNPNLYFDIDDQLDAINKMNAFVESVCQPLSDEIFDAVESFQRRHSMQALRKEIEKVTRLARPVDSAIIGRHMDEEFDRALPGHFSESPADQGRPRILSIEEEEKLGEALSDAHNAYEQQMQDTPPRSLKQPAFAPASKQPHQMAQSISNLQMAVRMTLLEGANLHKPPEQPVINHAAAAEGGQHEEDVYTYQDVAQEPNCNNSFDQTDDPSKAQDEESKTNQNDDQPDEQMAFISPSKDQAFCDDDSLGQGQQIFGSESKSNHNEPMSACETSFFEDWGPQAINPSRPQDQKQRLLKQMSLLRYKTADLSKHQSGPCDDEIDDEDEDMQAAMTDNQEHQTNENDGADGDGKGFVGASPALSPSLQEAAIMVSRNSSSESADQELAKEAIEEEPDSDEEQFQQAMIKVTTKS